MAAVVVVLVGAAAATATLLLEMIVFGGRVSAIVFLAIGVLAVGIRFSDGWVIAGSAPTQISGPRPRTLI